MDFKLTLIDNEGTLELVKLFSDQTMEEAPDYKVKTLSGVPTVLFIDGTKLPIDKRTQIVLAAYEASKYSGDKTFYLGPKYNTFAKDELDYLFFETDEKGNKNFVTEYAALLNTLLMVAESEKLIDKEEAHSAGIDALLEDNVHFVEHLMERYGLSKSEAIAKFVEDLARVPEEDNPDAPFMPSTGYKIVDVVEPAILGDGVSAYAQDIIFRDDILLINDLKKHPNGEGKEGYWAGVAISYEAPALKTDVDEITEYDIPKGILFAVEDLEVEGDGGIQTYSFALPDGGILLGPVPEAPKDPLTATEVSPLELHVTNSKTDSNPNGEGLAIYFDLTDKPQRSGKRITYQWIGEDDQYSSIRVLELTMDVTKNPFDEAGELTVDEELTTAFLVDVDGEPSVYDEKSIEEDKITVTGLKSHKAGNGQDGYWTGFALVDKTGKADGIILEVDGKVYNVSPLESKVDGEHDGVAFYFDAKESGESRKHVRYQWLKGDQASEVTDKTITFDITIAD